MLKELLFVGTPSVRKTTIFCLPVFCVTSSHFPLFFELNTLTALSKPAAELVAPFADKLFIHDLIVFNELPVRSSHFESLLTFIVLSPAKVTTLIRLSGFFVATLSTKLVAAFFNAANFSPDSSFVNMSVLP